MVSVKDADRLFLQSILSRRVVTQTLAALLYKKSMNAVKLLDDSIEFLRDSLEDAINRINDHLDPLKLQIKEARDEYSGTPLYILTNVQLEGDMIAQMATTYSVVEVSFFKAIVEQIMLAKNEAFCIGSTCALREATDLRPGLTKVQAQSVLGSFVTEGWLFKTSHGRYCLAPRTIAELDIYLKRNYEDSGYLECISCSDILTRGLGCCHGCQSRMHHACYERYSRGKQTYPCPGCKQEWSGPENRDRMRPIGEEAYKPGQDDKRRTRAAEMVAEVEDAYEDNDMEDDGPSDKGGRRSQSSRRSARRSVTDASE